MRGLRFSPDHGQSAGWGLPAILCFCLLGFSQAVRAADSTPTLSPLIQSIFPRGGRQGSESEVSIQGRYLEGASEIRVSGTGVAAKILHASESKIKAKVSIAGDASAGRRDLRIITPRGSFVQFFEVGTLPEQVESEPNDDWAKVPSVTMPVVVNGKILPGDYDHFRFRANAGQIMVFDLNSSRNGTRFDSVLSLLDEKGEEIAFQDDYYFDKDSHLVHRFECGGEYVLRVSGYRESGSLFSEYRLMMGELPSLSYLFPAGGQKGTQVELVLAGSNLDLVDQVRLNHATVVAEIFQRQPESLKVRMAIPSSLEPGLYPFTVQIGNTEIPHSLIFAISGTRELVRSEAISSEPLTLDTPVIINGRLRQPKQADSFWIEVQNGEQFCFDAQAMRLGNYLDPAITIYDSRGELVTYMDETAPNGFDKEPPQLDFHLVHRFGQAGRYRVEMRDASLRGRDDYVYRLLVSRAEPTFEVLILTNQITILPGESASLPVRVRHLGGWNTPVKVWLEESPAGVHTEAVVAEPANTRFRGTFSEDFFFDGTNVSVPLVPSEEAPFGTYPLQVKASGMINGKTFERTARACYPWQQTGYVRGHTSDGLMLMTIASTPLFDLEGPSSLLLTRGKPAEVMLAVRWFKLGKDNPALSIEPERLPAGLKIERFETKPGGDKVSVWISADEHVEELSERLSLVGTARLGQQTYRKAAPDIEVKVRKEKREVAVN